MWGKAKVDEDATAKAIRNRLVTVLGLDGSEFRDGACLPDDPSSSSIGKSHESDSELAFAPIGQAFEKPSALVGTAAVASTEFLPGPVDREQLAVCAVQEPVVPSTPNPSVTAPAQRSADGPGRSNFDSLEIQIRPALTGIETTRPPMHTMLARLSQNTRLGPNAEDGPHGQLEQKDQHNGFFGQIDTPNGPAGPQNGHVTSDALQSTVETALTDLTQRSEEIIERQARLFEQSLARIGTKTLSQAEASARRTVSRLENCCAEAQEVELTMDESLANVARKMTEAAHGQINVLEENLAKIAEQIGSRIQAEFEPMTKRVETYRAQAQEMSSSLETTLTRFTQRAEETAKGQARSFEEKVAKISVQAISQAQESFDSGITQLRETTAQSFEDRITSLGDTVERHLKENLEAWSKAQLEIVQQQASKVSADLLSRVRSDSESIAQQLYERLKSEAQLLESKTLGNMQGKLQKVTEEFHSILQRTFA